MSARDFYHRHVCQALLKDGWTITHDPYSLEWAKRRLAIDLGAERLIAAEKATQKIAVEVKSFLNESRIFDLQRALGQYVLYEEILAELDPDRALYLALPNDAFNDLFAGDRFAQILLDRNRLKVIAFSPELEEFIQWLP